MRLARQSRRRLVRQQKAAHSVAQVAIDFLESRRLFTETVGTIPAVLASTSNPATNSFALNTYFSNDTVPGTLAIFDTSLGSVDVALTDQATPNTVNNFLTYVTSGEYNGTFFHRSVNLNNNTGSNSSNEATIVQGGGYSIMNNSIGHIATNAPLADEYQTEVLHDTQGTLAMAKTSEANSATSEFYFNSQDNTELDNPQPDSNGVTTSYTVFGEVVNGFSIIQQIAQLPAYNLDPNNAALADVPVRGLTDSQAQQGAQITASNLVFVNTITTEPGTSYTATSDAKSLVSPTITNGVLSFSYGQGLSGTATITIVAKNLDGTSATGTVVVTVPSSTSPTKGPVAAPVTAPPVVVNTSEEFNVLSGDTDSLAALDPTKVAIVAQPSNGVASVNTSNGAIDYTPTAGYIGPDSLTYTVSDTNGATSAPATVTLQAVPTAKTITAASLTFIQPDGTTGHLVLTGGKALVTFRTYQVTTTTANGIVTASGPGAYIANIQLINNGRQNISATVTSTKPIELGPISSTGGVNVFKALTTTLTGEINFNHAAIVRAAAASNAVISVGSGFESTIAITNLTNTSLSGNVIAGIQAKQWLNTDGGNYNISATEIVSLHVTGPFAPGLNLTGRGFGIIVANVVQPQGTWGLSGSIAKATIGTPGQNWSLNCNGLVRNLVFTGNLANNITAAAITKMSVAGTTTGAVIETDAQFGAKFQQIGHIGFGGAVKGTVVFSAGNIGSISAASLTNSFIYAGVQRTVAQSGTVANTSSGLTANARIGSVTLGNAAAAFSNSVITADMLGSIHLGKIAASNGGSVEGVTAHIIGSFSGLLVPGGPFSAGPSQLKSAATLAAYEKLKKTNFGDFLLQIF